MAYRKIRDPQPPIDLSQFHPRYDLLPARTNQPDVPSPPRWCDPDTPTTPISHSLDQLTDTNMDAIPEDMPQRRNTVTSIRDPTIPFPIGNVRAVSAMSHVTYSMAHKSYRVPENVKETVADIDKRSRKSTLSTYEEDELTPSPLRLRPRRALSVGHDPRSPLPPYNHTRPSSMAARLRDPTSHALTAPFHQHHASVSTHSEVGDVAADMAGNGGDLAIARDRSISRETSNNVFTTFPKPSQRSVSAAPGARHAFPALRHRTSPLGRIPHTPTRPSYLDVRAARAQYNATRSALPSETASTVSTTVVLGLRTMVCNICHTTRRALPPNPFCCVDPPDKHERICIPCWHEGMAMSLNQRKSEDWVQNLG
jgi:hypothetical protein